MYRLHTGFELVAIWSEKVVESSLEMAELENYSPHEAQNWILSPDMSSSLLVFLSMIFINFYQVKAMPVIIVVHAILRILARFWFLSLISSTINVTREFTHSV